MARQRLQCKVCEYGRPKCDKGLKIHGEMTREFLKNHLQVTPQHKQRWQKWLKHEHN